ncbi:unnamed protein product [Cylindrotheca closterium]|uniref:Plastid lipid-associated protein/fibrillin conserved domain-containing protein n=1 Tax=Cylindrotheca closterium TaxID=2856 RepID=A0AAD2JLG5_9STRA|nr:unnamed protein product [Cylindrotheca closterium]
MKVLPNLFILFNLGKQEHSLPPSWAVSSATSLNLIATTKKNDAAAAAAVSSSVQRDEKIQDLLSAVSQVGQVGSLATEEERLKLEDLSKLAIPLSDSRPAQVPLLGEHKLLYSAAPGGSSGRLFGNAVGKVTQFFEEGEIFCNRVKFGPLQIALRAKREVKSDSVIKVSFLETTVSLFGKTVVQKEVGGGGSWKVKFIGKVTDENGKEKLIRIMETPSLFILEQPLN